MFGYRYWYKLFLFTVLITKCFLVEDTGIEPATSWMQIRRSPRWANPPFRFLVGRERLELSTPPLSRVCSNQLSYRPMTLHLGSSNDYNVSNLLEINGRETRTVIFVYVKWELKNKFLVILRKEVIQPQVPLRLPCYDFTPVADPTVVDCLLAVSASPSGRTNSHGVTGGVYKARERIHRVMLLRDY